MIKRMFAIMTTFLILFCIVGCKADTAASSSEVTTPAQSQEQENYSEESQTSSKNSTSNKPSSSKAQKQSSSKVQKQSSSKKQIATSSEKELTEREKILQGVDPTMYETALANKGNSARIVALMKKAANGGNYVIGALGGSITQGATTSSIDNRYVNLVLKWWQTNFPKATFELVNAGFGASTPQMACYRLDKDLLSKNPDFVIIDFAVNTSGDYYLEHTYSTLLNRVLNHSTSPAVMGITFTHVTSDSYLSGTYKMAKEFPSKAISDALEKYQIPTMSYHNYVWDKLNKRDENNRKVLMWFEIAADYIHPNDNGHRIAANLINAHLDYVKNNISSIQATSPSVPALTDTKFTSLGYITNIDSGISFTGGFNALSNNSTITRGWKYTYTQETSSLVIPLPQNSSVKVFMKFDDNTKGCINVSDGTGSTKKVIEVNVAKVPTLVDVGAMDSNITLTPELTGGGFTIYGICINP